MHQQYPSIEEQPEPLLSSAPSAPIKDGTPTEHSLRIVIPAPPEPGRLRWSLAPL